MYSLCSWETTAIDCYVNQEFGKVCVLLPTCSRMNILGACGEYSAWCGETGMKGVWLNWVLWQNSQVALSPGSTSTSPQCCTVRNSTADVPGPVSKQIWAPLKSAPWGLLFLGHSWKLCEQWFLLFWKLSELLGEWKLCSKWQKIFPNFCHVYNEQLWKVSGWFEWKHRKGLGGKPRDRSAACCATQNLFLTLVMMDVLIWLIFLLSFNVYCIKLFSFILYCIRATYSMLAMVLQWPNLIAEGRVLYNVVSFSQ